MLLPAPCRCVVVVAKLLTSFPSPLVSIVKFVIVKLDFPHIFLNFLHPLYFFKVSKQYHNHINAVLLVTIRWWPWFWLSQCLLGDTASFSASKSSIQRFVITEKAPTRAFSWLKAATTAFIFKTLLRHYAKRALTPRSLNVKLGPRRKGHKGRAGWLA